MLRLCPNSVAEAAFTTSLPALRQHMALCQPILRAGTGVRTFRLQPVERPLAEPATGPSAVRSSRADMSAEFIT